MGICHAAFPVFPNRHLPVAQSLQATVDWDFRAFEPGGVSFRHGGRQPMAKKVLDPKWQPKLLWTARRLAELSAEIDRLRKKVRVAETAVSKSLARARKLPSRHASQVDKQPRL